jgi:hypothetical protein
MREGGGSSTRRRVVCVMCKRFTAWRSMLSLVACGDAARRRNPKTPVCTAPAPEPERKRPTARERMSCDDTASMRHDRATRKPSLPAAPLSVSLRDGFDKATAGVQIGGTAHLAPKLPPACLTVLAITTATASRRRSSRTPCGSINARAATLPPRAVEPVLRESSPSGRRAPGPTYTALATAGHLKRSSCRVDKSIYRP